MSLLDILEREFYPAPLDNSSASEDFRGEETHTRVWTVAWLILFLAVMGVGCLTHTKK